MKKLSSTRQRKTQATTTNMVHVRQVESRCTGSGTIRRTTHNRARSSESTVQSSNSVAEEEESVATSILSNEMFDAGKIRSQESTTDAGTVHKGSTFISSHEPSESSLTLSLPREIRTSWLENDPSSKSEVDATAAKMPLPVQLQRTHTPENRSTAKSIFSTNKSVIMETQRNSISGRQPDASSAAAAVSGHASCRPPDYPPEVTSDTSEFSDVHQYQSLEASFNSHSDKEFRSASSKVPATEQETQGSDVALGVVPTSRQDSASITKANPYEASSRLDVGATESRGGLEAALRDSRSQPAVPANASTSLDVGMPGLNAADGAGSLLDGVSSRDAFTETTRSAMDVPSGASVDSRKGWSTDILPAVPISPTVSERDAAASLQNIPGKMADLFKAFAAPAKEAEEATSASSATFHTPSTGKKNKHYGSSQDVGRSSVSSKDLLPGQEANWEQVFGVPSMLGTDVAVESPHLDGHTSQKMPPGPPEAASHAPLPARKFSLQDDWDTHPECQAAFGQIPEAAWWNTGSGIHPSGATSSEQQRSTTMAGPGVLVPRPSAQQPQKHHSASHSQVGTTFYGVQSVRRVTETVTETHSRRSQSHTQSYTSGMPAATDNLRAIASSVEQPREPSVTGPVQAGAVSLKGAHDKRAKPEAAISSLPGQRSPKSAVEEHHKHSSTRRTPPGAASMKEPQFSENSSTAQSTAAGGAFPKGERHKRSSHSPTTSGAASPKAPADSRSEHATGRRSPAGTSSSKVATAGGLQKTASVLDWRGAASIMQPGLAPIDERLERSTTSFSISEAPAPKPKAHERGAANVDVGTAGLPVATSSVLGTATDAYESMYPLAQPPFADPAAIAQLAAATNKTLGDQMTETTKLSESTTVRPNVMVEQRFQQSVTRSYSLIPLTDKGPDESRQTGFSATISSEVNITQEHGKTTTETGVSGSVLHTGEKPAVGTESTVTALQGAEHSRLPEKSYTADLLKEKQEYDGKMDDLEKLSRQKVVATEEKPQTSEIPGLAQGNDDLKLSGEPHKPETPDGVSTAPEEPSCTTVDQVLSFTNSCNQAGLTSASDIATEESRTATAVPEKTVDALQETFGEERLRPSASSPVSTEGREPGFLFEEPLKRPIVSSSWTETSTQDEERRRSSGVGAPRATHTVPAALGEEHAGHLALIHGEAEAHHRRTSAPTTGLAGMAGTSAQPEEGAAAERSTVPGEPTSKDRQRGSQDRSHSLTPDNSGAQATKRADLDHHGDMSRKSEEAACVAAVTQDLGGAVSGGLFPDESDRLLVPVSEESASDRPATVSDSRGFQPLFGESLPSQARTTGASEFPDAMRKETSPEDIVSGAPTDVLLEPEAMSRGSAEDDDVEEMADLYPLLGPDELRPSIPAVLIASEPRGDLIDFEQSTGDMFNMREDGSSSTFLPFSSEVRKEFGSGLHGAPGDMLEEQYDKYRECSESELRRGIAGSPADLVFLETALLSRSTSPCTALVELPSEQHITEATSRELLEQHYLGLDDEPLGDVSSIPLESEQHAGSHGTMVGTARVFHVTSSLAGMFPPVQVTVMQEGLAQQQQISLEQHVSKPPKERKIVPTSAEAEGTGQGIMETAAPVIALSFALVAFVAAAAILFGRGDEFYPEL